MLDTGGILRAAVDRILTQMPAIGPLDGVLITGDISDDGGFGSRILAGAANDRSPPMLLKNSPSRRMVVLPGNHPWQGRLWKRRFLSSIVREQISDFSG
ncbi:hypothetical protein [Roseinatronobacter alkalisoli]|uniref:Calcineurin-like phosphoesterase domain-containing protein n=1 Tax=Roseinatronobacter alkalisoli TaxID=3028235 RepID=A0ABT5TDQ6_9RHOB|nr:hypothetical protein [Roseinatronobacter sp. HJB301]MDD7973257.1 hypothetical protein [Roseinatronobacter sp. HJB301]